LSERINITGESLHDLIQYKKQTAVLEKEILKLKKSISNCKQFNQRVELNGRLKKLEQELQSLRDTSVS
jgi:transposase-like protein